MVKKGNQFSKDFYIDLIEHASDLIQCVNAAGEFTYVNRAWKEKLNYSETDLNSLKLWDVIHPDSLDHCQLTFERVINGSHLGLVEAVFITRGGDPLPVEGSVNCRFDPEGSVISTRGIFRDVSQQREKEQQVLDQQKLLEEQILLQDLLSQVTASFNETGPEDFDESVNQAIKSFGEYVSADRVYIFDYDFDGGVCHNTYEWCQAGITPEIDNLQNVPLEMMEDWVKAHTAGKTVYIPDVFALEPEDGVRILLEPQGVKSLMTLPMMRGKCCEGFIGFDSVRNHHRYTNNEERILWQLSTVLRSAIARVSLARAVNESEERFRRLFQEVPSIAVQGYQPDSTVSYWNQASEALYGYTADEAIGKSIFDLIIPDFLRTQVEENFRRMIAEGIKPDPEELSLRHKNGSLIPVYSSHTILDYADQRKEFFCLDIDLRELKKMEDLLALEKEQFRTTLLSVGDGVISTDQYGCIVMMNANAERMTGWSQPHALGRPLQEVYTRVHETSKKPLADPAEYVLKTGEGFHSVENTLLISRTHIETYIEENIAPIKNNAGKVTGVVIVLRDISEKREKQKQIEYLSFRDQLTGLYNRRYIEDAVTRLDTRRNLPFSVIILDVNGLKLTNDAFGHKKGDQLLRTVAEIISKPVRADDIIGRMGGDEFALLLPKTSLDEAEKVKERIISLASKTRLDSIIVSLAAGVAVKTSEAEDIASVIQQADNNMYRNKLIHGKVMRSQTIEILIRSIHNKYDQEQIHTERVSQYCELIARALNFSETEISGIKTAALLHDIGKITIPPEILNKHNPLTEKERQTIQQHPRSGYQLLRNVDEFAIYADHALYHHERWDGKGYPRGLQGEAIPLGARIIAVADAYEAMTAIRPYQSTKSSQAALEELQRQSGSQFDPQIVKVFTEIMS